MQLLKALVTATIALSYSQIGFSHSTQTKLEHQFKRYAAVEEFWAKTVGKDGRTLSRADWEAILAPQQGYSFTAEDLQELVADQRGLERQNAEHAKAESQLDLSILRDNSEQRAKFCREIPKGGMLHVHVSGTTDRRTVKALLQKYDPQFQYGKMVASLKGFIEEPELNFLSELQEPRNYSGLQRMQRGLEDLFILPSGNNHSFARFIGLFIIRDFYKTPQNSLELSEIVIRDFLERAKKQNVTYVEFTNEPSADYPLVPENIQGLEALVKAWEEEFGIVVRFNYSFLRFLDPEFNRRLATQLLNMKSSVITGIDLLGDETNTHALEQAQGAYATVSNAVKEGQSNLQMTMHAGELGHEKNTRDALIFGVKRIGHGVLLENDPIALEYARRKQVGIETNLISNLRLGVMKDLRKHPFLKYLRLGLKPSLSTDDEGMMETDMNTEVCAAITHSDISYSELRQLILNSIETSFVDMATQERLHRVLVQDLAQFEARWAKKLSKK